MKANLYRCSKLDSILLYSFISNRSVYSSQVCLLNCLILDFVIIQYILILVIYTLIRKNNNNKIYHKCVRMLFNFCVKKVYRNILFFITERVTRYISIWWINSLLQRRSWWRKYTDCWNDLGISQYWIILNSK